MDHQVIKKYALSSEAQAQLCCMLVAISGQVSGLRDVVTLLCQIIIPSLSLGEPSIRFPCEQSKHYVVTRRNKVLFIMLIQEIQQKLRVSIAWEHYS